MICDLFMGFLVRLWSTLLVKAGSTEEGLQFCLKDRSEVALDGPYNDFARSTLTKTLSTLGIIL